jgi:uncharacterized protein YndB with AHSA1/START domain
VSRPRVTASDFVQQPLPEAPMAHYSFVTTWRFRHPRERVWQALNTPEDYHKWWPCMVACRALTPGVTGVGARHERAVRGRLPYVLRYTTTVTRSEPPAEVAYDAGGDLVGHGRFVLTPTDDGTEVVFHWDVSTTGKVLNLLAPLLSWLFAWNHNWVMARGQRGLAEWLAREGPTDLAHS